jgi:hypothetical protein
MLIKDLALSVAKIPTDFQQLTAHFSHRETKLLLSAKIARAILKSIL